LREIVLAPVPGRVPYRRGLELQRALGRARIDGRLDEDLLLLVEHEPVVTLGRTTGGGHLTAGREGLAARGIDVVEIERGGDVTYHGPGQAVGYPILDLRGYRKDLHWYLRAVEEGLIRALGELGLPAFRVPGHTGVWVGEEGAEGHDAMATAILSGGVRKIASIGVHVSRWVTWHGFALNLTEEPMEAFRLIVPCGIEGVRMTSLEAEGAGTGPRRLREALAVGFGAAFGARVREEERTLEVLEEAARHEGRTGGAAGASPRPSSNGFQEDLARGPGGERAEAIRLARGGSAPSVAGGAG